MLKQKNNLVDQKGENFFRVDKDGRDVFYPLAFPGNGFWVEAGMKRAIQKFLRIFCMSLVLGIVLVHALYYSGVINVYGKIIAYDVIWLVFPLWYYLRMRGLSKITEQVTVSDNVIPKVFYFFVFCFLIQIASIVGALNAYSESPVFMIYSLLWHTVYAAGILFLMFKSMRPVFCARM